MKKNTKVNSVAKLKSLPIASDLALRFWEESWTYIKIIVDTMREPFLILDEDLRVMVANEPFYRAFQTEPKETEKKLVYELGNGQWDIPDLRRLLEDILPKNTFFKGFEVIHEFPLIGRKIMILNAREICKNGSTGVFPPIILLAMEDVTEMMVIAEKLGGQASQLETKMLDRTRRLEAHILKLEKDFGELKSRDL